MRLWKEQIFDDRFDHAWDRETYDENLPLSSQHKKLFNFKIKLKKNHLPGV